jgi:hypothetical protein
MNNHELCQVAFGNTIKQLIRAFVCREESLRKQLASEGFVALEPPLETGPGLRCFDVSSLVDAIQEQHDAFAFMHSKVRDILRSSIDDVFQEKSSWKIIDSAFESAVSTSLHQVAKFSACLTRDFESVQRHDALVVGTDRSCVVSLNRVGTRVPDRADAILSSDLHGGNDSCVYVFKNVNEVCLFTETDRHIDLNTAAYFNCVSYWSSESVSFDAEWVVFVHELSAEMTINEEVAEISATKARDLFYGSKLDLLGGARQIYDGEPSKGLRRLTEWNGKHVAFTREELNAWTEGYAVSLERQDERDNAYDGPLVSDKRAAQIFWGRKPSLRGLRFGRLPGRPKIGSD